MSRERLEGAVGRVEAALLARVEGAADSSPTDKLLEDAQKQAAKAKDAAEAVPRLRKGPSGHPAPPRCVDIFCSIQFVFIDLYRFYRESTAYPRAKAGPRDLQKRIELGSLGRGAGLQRQVCMGSELRLGWHACHDQIQFDVAILFTRSVRSISFSGLGQLEHAVGKMPAPSPILEGIFTHPPVHRI